MALEVSRVNQFKETIEKIIREKPICGIIEPDSIPTIDLYMDQVTTFMESHLGAYRRTPEDKVLTKTMINNYAKARLFPAPVKKKYTKNHIMLLIMIFHLKTMLSISDIDRLLKPITSTLDVSEPSAHLEKIYRGFVMLQKKYIHGQFYSVDEVLQDDFFLGFTRGTEEEVYYILSILSLAIQTNAEKYLAEKLLDLKFPKAIVKKR